MKRKDLESAAMARCDEDDAVYILAGLDGLESLEDVEDKLSAARDILLPPGGEV